MIKSITDIEEVHTSRHSEKTLNEVNILMNLISDLEAKPHQSKTDLRKLTTLMKQLKNLLSKKKQVV